MLVKVEHDRVVKYPYQDIMMMHDNPNVSFPQTITKEIREQFGVYEVESTIPPNIDSNTQKVIELDPIQNNGVWEQAWEIVTLSYEEQNILRINLKKEIIEKRNKFLIESDFTQLADVNLSNKADWQIYRQALRDIPQQSTFPYNVIWPKMPDSGRGPSKFIVEN